MRDHSHERGPGPWDGWKRGTLGFPGEFEYEVCKAGFHVERRREGI